MVTDVAHFMGANPIARADAVAKCTFWATRVIAQPQHRPPIQLGPPRYAPPTGPGPFDSGEMRDEVKCVTIGDSLY